MISKTKITARYAETDQMGVIHHAVYPVWFEAARTDYIKNALGVSYTQLEGMGVISPLARLECRYHTPARYEDELTVEVRTAALTPARIEFGYTVRRNADGAVLCEGATLHGWVDKATFRPVNMKKRFPDLYQIMLDGMKTLVKE